MFDTDGTRLPGLTAAEADLLHHYLAALDSLARINPARADHTIGALHAAQALVAHAGAIRDALAALYQRGQTELDPGTLARALVVLGAPARIARLAVTTPPER
jgi:hypothetical protein